jgi:hypothetical protein
LDIQIKQSGLKVSNSKVPSSLKTGICAKWDWIINVLRKVCGDEGLHGFLVKPRILSISWGTDTAAFLAPQQIFKFDTPVSSTFIHPQLVNTTCCFVDKSQKSVDGDPYGLSIVITTNWSFGSGWLHSIWIWWLLLWHNYSNVLYCLNQSSKFLIVSLKGTV